ncbi:MAG: spore cortex biosynthesis protein YabQ [Oscillospiraceae bacterium]
MYSITLSRQVINFLLSLGFGFIAGVFYDIFRIIRLIFSKNNKSSKTATIIFDILYIIVAGIATFMFSLTVTNGEIRGYLLAGEGIGFFIYYFTFGIFVLNLSNKIVAFVKSFFKKLFRVVFTPFIWIFKRIKNIFTKIIKKTRKSTKKVVKKSKFSLQVNNSLMYNLIGRVKGINFCSKSHKRKMKK